MPTCARLRPRAYRHKDAGSRQRARASGLSVALALASCFAGAPLAAQSSQNAPQPAVHKRNPTGSPLDTLLNTKIWPEEPEAKAFVRESRPPEDSLDYQPPWGPEPQRAKPRSQAELDALKRELGGAESRNKARGAAVTPAGQ